MYFSAKARDLRFLFIYLFYCFFPLSPQQAYYYQHSPAVISPLVALPTIVSPFIPLRREDSPDSGYGQNSPAQPVPAENPFVASTSNINNACPFCKYFYPPHTHLLPSPLSTLHTHLPSLSSLLSHENVPDLFFFHLAFHSHDSMQHT